MAPVTDPEAHEKTSYTCTADVFDLIASVAETSKYTVNMFGTCFDQHAAKSECVNAGLGLAQSVAEIVSSNFDMDSSCWDHVARAPDSRELDAVECVVDVKKTTRFSLDTLGAAMSIKKRCDYSPTECTAGIFDGIGSIAGVAEYVFAAFGDCGSKVPMNTQCGKTISKLVKGLSSVASVATHVKSACTSYDDMDEEDSTESTALAGFKDGLDSSFEEDKLKDELAVLVGAAAKAMPRKYSRNKIPNESVSSGVTLTNAILFAAIPVFSTIAFFGGRRSSAAAPRLARIMSREPQEDSLMPCRAKAPSHEPQEDPLIA